MLVINKIDTFYNTDTNIRLVINLTFRHAESTSCQYLGLAPLAIFAKNLNSFIKTPDF